MINGLFPIENYTIDGFLFKTAKYNEKMIEAEDEDHVFYSSSYLALSCYGAKGKDGAYYNYFENDNNIEIEIEDSVLASKRKLSEYMLDYMCKRVSNLEKRLRLITNFSIGLPVFRVMIYDSNDEYITQVGFIAHKVSLFNIYKYDDFMKKNFVLDLDIGYLTARLKNLKIKIADIREL